MRAAHQLPLLLVSGCLILACCLYVAAPSEAHPSAASAAATQPANQGTSWVGLPCDRKSAVKSSISQAMSEFEADPLEIIKLGRERLLELKQREAAAKQEQGLQLVPAPATATDRVQQVSASEQQQLVVAAPTSPIKPAEVPPQVELKPEEPQQQAGPKSSKSKSKNKKRNKNRKKKNRKQSPLAPETPDVVEMHASQSAEEAQQAGQDDEEAEAEEQHDDAHSVVDESEPSHMHLLPPVPDEHAHHLEEEEEHHEEHPLAVEPHLPMGDHHHHDEHRTTLLPSGPPPLPPVLGGGNGPSPPAAFQQRALMDDLSLKHQELPSPAVMPGVELHAHHQLDQGHFGVAPEVPAPHHHLPQTADTLPGADETPEAAYMDNFSQLPGYSGALPELSPHQPHQRAYNRHSRPHFPSKEEEEDDDEDDYAANGPRDYHSESEFVDNSDPRDPYQVHLRRRERRHQNRFGGSQEQRESSLAYSLKNPRNYRRRYASTKSSYSGPNHRRRGSYPANQAPSYLRGSPAASLYPLSPLAGFAALPQTVVYETPVHHHHHHHGSSASAGYWPPPGTAATAYAATSSAGYPMASAVTAGGAPLAFAQPAAAGYYATSSGPAYAAAAAMGPSTFVYADDSLYGDHLYNEAPLRYHNSNNNRRQSKGQRYRANKRARQAAAAAASATSSHY